MARIKIKAREVRGLTYLPHGQQYGGYLPKGEYETDGQEVLLRYTDLGIVKESPAIVLVPQFANEGKWYVAPSVIAKTRTN